MKRSELLIGFLLGFATLLVILVLCSDFAAHYEICEPTKEGAKECASYNVLSYAMHKIGAAFDSYNGLITAIATAFIAWFTLTLRRSTDRLWESAQEQSRITENAFSQLEGPLIDISKITTEIEAGADYSVRRGPLVAVHFKNHGRGPARFTLINCRYTFVEKVPDVPPYLRGNAQATTLILGSGQETGAPYIYELDAPSGEVGTQAFGVLLFFGLIEYKGIFGGTHTYAFGCAPDRKRGTFETKGGSVYNYRKYDPAQGVSERGPNRPT